MNKKRNTKKRASGRAYQADMQVAAEDKGASTYCVTACGRGNSPNPPSPHPAYEERERQILARDSSTLRMESSEEVYLAYRHLSGTFPAFGVLSGDNIGDSKKENF